MVAIPKELLSPIKLNLWITDVVLPASHLQNAAEAAAGQAAIYAWWRTIVASCSETKSCQATKRVYQDMDERILKPILEQVEVCHPATNTPIEHITEENLVLYSRGQLRDVEQQSMMEHLDTCSICRQAASLLIRLENGTVGVERSSKSSTSGWRQLFPLALAACVVLAVTLVIFFKANNSGGEQDVYRSVVQLLDTGDFRAARVVLSRAANRNITSERLFDI